MLDVGSWKGGIKVHRLNLSSLDKHGLAIQFLCIIEISNNSIIPYIFTAIPPNDKTIDN